MAHHAASIAIATVTRPMNALACCRGAPRPGTRCHANFGAALSLQDVDWARRWCLTLANSQVSNNDVSRISRVDKRNSIDPQAHTPAVMNDGTQAPQLKRTDPIQPVAALVPSILRKQKIMRILNASLTLGLGQGCNIRTLHLATHPLVLHTGPHLFVMLFLKHASCSSP